MPFVLNIFIFKNVTNCDYTVTRTRSRSSDQEAMLGPENILIKLSRLFAMFFKYCKIASVVQISIF